MDEKLCDLAVVVDRVKALHDEKLVWLDRVDDAAGGAVPFMVLPEGRRLEPLRWVFDQYLPRPRRVSGTARADTLDSFIALVNRYKAPGSAIFARRELSAPYIRCVVDPHVDAATPDWGEHKIVYLLPLAAEWQAWTGVNREWLPQADFAAWIEEHVIDIAAPGDIAEPPIDVRRYHDAVGGELAGPSALVTLSRGLKLTEAAKVVNAVNLDSGETAVTFHSEHKDEAGKKLKVPNLFLLAIPVVEDGPRYVVAARLRYRLREGKVLWSIDLWRTDLVFRHAFDEALVRVANETGLPVYAGRQHEG